MKVELVDYDKIETTVRLHVYPMVQSQMEWVQVTKVF